MKTYTHFKEIPLLDRDFDALEDLGRRIEATRSGHYYASTFSF